MKIGSLKCVLVLSLLLNLTVYAEEHKVIFREDFNSLAGWKPLYFPKIEKNSSYTIESDGEMNYLKAVSVASASALVINKTFNVYQHPMVNWRWKVENVYMFDITLVQC